MVPWSWHFTYRKPYPPIFPGLFQMFVTALELSQISYKICKEVELWREWNNFTLCRVWDWNPESGGLKKPSLGSFRGWKQIVIISVVEKKILLFLAFFQLLSACWTVQVGVYYSALRSEPESFLMGCLMWKCRRTTILHCEQWANAHRWQTWLSACASLYLFNPTKAASVHGREIHVAMSARTGWSCDSKWNTNFWFWVALHSRKYLKTTVVCLYQGAYTYKIKYVFGGPGRCIYSPIWVFANMEKQVFV